MKRPSRTSKNTERKLPTNNPPDVSSEIESNGFDELLFQIRDENKALHNLLKLIGNTESQPADILANTSTETKK
jgi:hypothetical protein